MSKRTPDDDYEHLRAYASGYAEHIAAHRPRTPWVRIIWSLVFATLVGIYARHGQWGWALICLAVVLALFGSAVIQHRRGTL